MRGEQHELGIIRSAIAAAVLFVACGVSHSGAPPAGSQAGTTGYGGKAGDGGTSGGTDEPTAARGGSAGNVMLPPPDASSDARDDVDIEPDAACGIGSAEASLRPVSLLVMFDRSTSMTSDSTVDPATGLDRWQTATGALKRFLADPGAEGLGVALRFFPDDRPSVGCTQEGCCTEESCWRNTPEAVAACSDVLVDLAALQAESAPDDAHEAALVAAVDSSTPMKELDGVMAIGGTPISAALAGALEWAVAHQGARPEGHTAVLFVTDGAPAGCDERTAIIAGLAQEAFESAGVTTFAVGLADAEGEGVHASLMNEIATAGGTGEAFFINDGPTAADSLLATLNAIRGRALPCDFPMPEATSDGIEIDPGLVNVTYTAGDGTDTRFTKVLGGAGACYDSVSWYYDDEDAPTRVVLCPAACELVASDPQARFEILLGCAPDLEPPR